MRAREFILLEYRRDITVKNLGPRLLSRNSRDNIKFKSAEEILEFLETNDPTKNRQYTLWLANRYIAGDFLLEDASVVRRYLAKFMELQPVFKQNNLSVDIGRYDLSSLKEAVNSVLKVDSGKDISKVDELLPVVPGTKVLYNGPEGQFVIPLTVKGSQALQDVGKETEWCTADSRATTWFDSYAKEGPLYVWISRDSGKKFQFHFPSGQYMDQLDSRLSSAVLDNFLEYPPIRDNIDWRGAERDIMAADNPPDYIPDIFFKSRAFCEQIVKKKNMSNILRRIPREFMTEQLLKDAVESYASNIEDVPPELITPSLADYAVEVSPWTITYIPRNMITVDMAKVIALKAPQYMMEVPEELITAEIALDGFRTTNVSGELGNARKVWNATPASVLQDPKFIKKMVEVNQLGLSFVPYRDRTSELCKMAVTKYPTALKYVPNDIQDEFSDELLVDIMRRDGNALGDVKEGRITPAMSIAAVKQNGMALEHVPMEQRTWDLCLVAVRENAAAIWHVPYNLRVAARQATWDNR